MKNLTATICLTIAVLLGSAGESNAQGVDGSWVVTDHAGEAWSANIEEIIGKTQIFDRGWAEGVFFECDFGGRSSVYTSYRIDEFLANKEFILFKELGFLNKYDGEIFVHRITCDGKKQKNRQVLYPFVSIKPDWTKSFYLYEGGIYSLSYQN